MANIAKTTVALTIAILFLAMVILPMMDTAMEGITDDNIKAILDVIPLIFAVGVLMAGAYMLFGRSYRRTTPKEKDHSNNVLQYSKVI